jgi:hypothetical protein
MRIRLGEFEVECASVDELRAVFVLMREYELVELMEDAEAKVEKHHPSPVAQRLVEKPVPIALVANRAQRAVERRERVAGKVEDETFSCGELLKLLPDEFPSYAACSQWVKGEVEAGRMVKVAHGTYQRSGVVEGGERRAEP